MIAGKKILLTGASGWFGKSFILNYAARFSEKALSNLILVTSDGRGIKVPGINSTLKTIPLSSLCSIDIRVDAVIQSAFLTRDKIGEYDEFEFRSINNNIITCVSSYVKNNKIPAVFVISSGAVNDTGRKKDLYSELKQIEEATFSKLCDPVVFRVYGAAGKLTPKVSWSALSEFISQGKCKKNILIKSKGRVLRSYVSFDVLSEVILECINDGETVRQVIDACSFNTDIFSLAMSVSKVYDVKVEKNQRYDPAYIADSYIGDCEKFIAMCDRYNIYLPNIEELILISSESPFL